MVILLFIAILLILLIFYIRYHVDNTVIVKFRGYNYRVIEDKPENKLKKVKILHKIRTQLQTLVDHLYKNNVPTKADAKRVKERFSRIDINEMPKKDKNIAYVKNKDEELRICLTDIDGVVENFNDTIFVCLHELSHVMSVKIGHGAEFKKNMDHIVKTAVKIGVYDPTDYSKRPVRYCGRSITSTPCENNGCSIVDKN